MSQEFDVALGNRLRDLRTGFGMSQIALGEAVGLPRSAVTQIELGNRGVTVEELVRFASAFQSSLSAILNDLDKELIPNVDGLVDAALDLLINNVLKTLPRAETCESLREELTRFLTLCRFMTDLEADVGVDVYGPEAFIYRGAPPRSPWEATCQGAAAADEERRRLDLGSAPIRDLGETLALLRIRTARLDLPEAVQGLYIHTKETGPLVLVNQRASFEECRFQYSHGFAHVLFDRGRDWIICEQTSQGGVHEIRANAFASRFLLPVEGIRRYLASIGRDTMAQTSGGAVDLLSDGADAAVDDARVRVSGRARRGAWAMNPYELAQLASYFGVSESLQVHGLKNLRFLSGDTRDALSDEIESTVGGGPRKTLGLARNGGDRGHEAFVSRLIALATEARRRETITTERIAPIVPLLGLEDKEARRLLGTMTSAEKAEERAQAGNRG